jgi:uncharacterized protein DUF4265
MTEMREVKIRFPVEQSEGLEVRTEGVWAEPEGGGTFRILNSPFFVYGISAGDSVLAELNDGVLEFLQVRSRGGHSTYRLFLDSNLVVSDLRFRDFWQPISALGATFENANNHFVAVDVPPGRDLDEIYKLMESGEKAGVWEFEEGYRYQPPQ